jgi:hypothetical protein
MAELELRPSTELEAVNFMLATIGESPVNTLEDNGVVDAVLARQFLTMTSRRTQAKGWHWNTEKALVLPRTFPEGYVPLPRAVLKVDTVGPSFGVDVAIRGNRLYDRVNHTFTFATDLTVDLVLMLPFEDLSETARQYIMIAASRSFQEKIVGSEALAKFSQRDELMAWSDLVNEEAENGDYNVFDGMGLDR